MSAITRTEANPTDEVGIGVGGGQWHQAALQLEAPAVVAHDRSARRVSAARCSAFDIGDGPRSDDHFGIESL